MEGKIQEERFGKVWFGLAKFGIQEERFGKVWFGLARFGIQEERFGKGGTGARSDRLGNDGGLQVRYQH